MYNQKQNSSYFNKNINIRCKTKRRTIIIEITTVSNVVEKIHRSQNTQVTACLRWGPLPHLSLWGPTPTTSPGPRPHQSPPGPTPHLSL